MNRSRTRSSSGISRARRAQHEIERFVREARHLGFVGNLEPGIDVGFEWEFPQQAEAERVDCRYLDIADAVFELAP